VIDDGKFLGIITLKEVKNVPREDWGKVKVSGVFVPHDKKWEVSMNDDVIKANIVAVGIIERQKIGHITFGQWIKPGTIVSIPTLAIATLFLYLQFY
jgi:hypothetical protein